MRSIRTKTRPFLSISSSSHEPRRRHQVRGEDLLRGVLRLHDVGAGGPHELRHDDALRAVDHERAGVGHLGDVPHEDALLADLARGLVDEADRHEQRLLVGQVLLAALADGVRGGVEDVVAEFHGERTGVVLDRRDVVDRFADTGRQEVEKRLPLDFNQVRNRDDPRKLRGLLQVGEVPTGALTRRSGHSRSQERSLLTALEGWQAATFQARGTRQPRSVAHAGASVAAWPVGFRPLT